MAHTVATLIPFIGEERDTVKKVSELLRESKLDDRQKSELQKSTSDAESEFKETIEEYRDLAEVVRQWHATHPGWRGAMLQGKVEICMGTTFTAQQTSETPRGHISQRLSPPFRVVASALEAGGSSVRGNQAGGQWSVRKRRAIIELG